MGGCRILWKQIIPSICLGVHPRFNKILQNFDEAVCVDPKNEVLSHENWSAPDRRHEKDTQDKTPRTTKQLQARNCRLDKALF